MCAFTLTLTLTLAQNRLGAGKVPGCHSSRPKRKGKRGGSGGRSKGGGEEEKAEGVGEFVQGSQSWEWGEVGEGRGVAT